MPSIAESKSTKLTLTDEEKQLFVTVAKKSGVTFKQLAEEALAVAITHWHRGNLPAIVVPRIDSRQHSVRLDGLLLETLNERLNQWFGPYTSATLSMSNLIITALWDLIDQKSIPELENDRLKISGEQVRLRIEFGEKMRA